MASCHRSLELKQTYTKGRLIVLSNCVQKYIRFFNLIILMLKIHLETWNVKNTRNAQEQISSTRMHTGWGCSYRDVQLHGSRASQRMGLTTDQGHKEAPCEGPLSLAVLKRGRKLGWPLRAGRGSSAVTSASPLRRSSAALQAAVPVLDQIKPINPKSTETARSCWILNWPINWIQPPCSMHFRNLRFIIGSGPIRNQSTSHLFTMFIFNALQIGREVNHSLDQSSIDSIDRHHPSRSDPKSTNLLGSEIRWSPCSFFMHIEIGWISQIGSGINLSIFTFSCSMHTQTQTPFPFFRPWLIFELP